MAKRVETNTPAPEIEALDYRGEPFRLSSLRGQKHVLLVFNRGFA